MIVIYKYNLNITRGEQTIHMPCNAKILHVENQADADGIMLWAAVDPDFSTEYRVFRVVATGEGLGEDIDDLAPLHHIGTVVIQRAGLVWHVFEVREPSSEWGKLVVPKWSST